MQAEINELKALENAVNAENSKVIAEMKTDYAKELDDLKASAYQVQTAYDAKCLECEEARSQLKEVNELSEGLRKDLTASHDDKAAQVRDFNGKASVLSFLKFKIIDPWQCKKSHTLS